MPPRDPNAVQLDFPVLVADIIEQLRLTGQIGLLNFSPEVVPVYLAAIRDGVGFPLNPTVWESAEWFNGQSTNPAIGVVTVDTGQLPAGTYDLILDISYVGQMAVGFGDFRVEHRNAANAATLAVLGSAAGSGINVFGHWRAPIFGYVLALNERIRVLNTQALAGSCTANIAVAIRPAP